MVKLAKALSLHSAERALVRPFRHRLSPKVLSESALLQRKTACACGGGCPRCQLATPSGPIFSEPDGVYEREADAVADRVMDGMDSEATSGGSGLPEGLSLTTASAPMLAREEEDAALSGDAPPEYQLASLDCNPFDDEGFPILKRGNYRNAVGLAQRNLNKVLPKIVACLSDPACMAGYTPKAQNFMREQMAMLSRLPIDVDCQFGLDTLHATYAVQAFFFKNEIEWDGIIGPQTWRGIDEFAPLPPVLPDFPWDYVVPPTPPPQPIFL